MWSELFMKDKIGRSFSTIINTVFTNINTLFRLFFVKSYVEYIKTDLECVLIMVRIPKLTVLHVYGQYICIIISL